MGGRRKITDLDPFPLFWNLELPEETTKKVTKELPNKNCICTAEPAAAVTSIQGRKKRSVIGGKDLWKRCALSRE